MFGNLQDPKSGLSYPLVLLMQGPLPTSQGQGCRAGEENQSLPCGWLETSPGHSTPFLLTLFLSLFSLPSTGWISSLLYHVWSLMECPKGVTDGVEVRGLAVGQEEIPQELPD